MNGSTVVSTQSVRLNQLANAARDPAACPSARASQRSAGLRLGRDALSASRSATALSTLRRSLAHFENSSCALVALSSALSAST